MGNTRLISAFHSKIEYFLNTLEDCIPKTKTFCQYALWQALCNIHFSMRKFMELCVYSVELACDCE